MFPRELWEEVRAVLPPQSQMKARLLLGRCSYPPVLIYVACEKAIRDDNCCWLAAAWQLPVERRHQLFRVAFVKHRPNVLARMKQTTYWADITSWISDLLRHRYLHLNERMRDSLADAVLEWGLKEEDIHPRAMEAVMSQDAASCRQWLKNLFLYSASHPRHVPTRAVARCGAASATGVPAAF